MKINERKAGAILSYVQIILNNTIALIYTPFALRMLGQSQYGLFGTASSYTSYLSLLSLGIGGAYIRWNAKYRAAKDEEGERRLNGMYFTIFFVISVVMLLVGALLVVASKFVFAKEFSSSELQDLQYIILLQVISTSMTMFLTPIIANIQAYEKFLFLRIVAMVSSVVTPIGNCLVLLLGGKSVALTLLGLGFNIITLIIYFVYATKRLNMRFIFKEFDKKVLKEIFFFSSFLLLDSLTGLLTESTDSVILGACCGTAAVAIYTVGHNFKKYFLGFSTSISGVFSPKVNQMVAEHDDNKELLELMTRVGRVQFYIVSLIMIGYSCVGQSFVCLWAGDDYASAYWIGLFLLTGAYIPLFQNVGIEILKAKNKHKVRSIIYLLVAILNAMLTIPFAIWWEGIGAAAATFIACMLGNVLFMNIYYYKGAHLDMPYFWKEIFKIVPSFLPAICVGILVNKFLPIHQLTWLFVAIVLITVVYLFSVYKFAMNAYEKDLLLKPIKKVFAKAIKK